MVDEVSRAAYSGRASEYIELLGSMGSVHQSDRQLVSSWASEVDGELIDAGCGPGHWTNFLAEQGRVVRGVDMVPEFIAHASRAYPSVNFTLGSLDNLDAATGSLAGILSWFSLIHHEPEAIRIFLAEFSRTLKSGGMLLIGFFEGAVVEEFAHAVTPAYVGQWMASVQN